MSILLSVVCFAFSWAVRMTAPFSAGSTELGSSSRCAFGTFFRFVKEDFRTGVLQCEVGKAFRQTGSVHLRCKAFDACLLLSLPNDSLASDWRSLGRFAGIPCSLLMDRRTLPARATASFFNPCHRRNIGYRSLPARFCSLFNEACR